MSCLFQHKSYPSLAIKLSFLTIFFDILQSFDYMAMDLLVGILVHLYCIHNIHNASFIVCNLDYKVDRELIILYQHQFSGFDNLL